MDHHCADGSLPGWLHERLKRGIVIVQKLLQGRCTEIIDQWTNEIEVYTSKVPDSRRWTFQIWYTVPDFPYTGW